MRSKAIFMALLAFAFGAQAVPVSVDQAKSAARAWAVSGVRLGTYLGNRVSGVSTQVTSNGMPVHMVRMTDGGTVLISGDTAFEPILAFTSEQVESIDEKSPLWALVNGDMSYRKRMTEAKSGSLAFQAGAPENPRWAALLSTANSRGPAASGTDAADPIQNDDDSVIDDLRVGILVQTKWGQSRMSGANCCNYYTPKHYVCGCVATALAQTMRYHKWPQDPIAAFTEKCSCDGQPQDYTIEAGKFDWGNMPERIVSSESQCQAIGWLTYACGVAVNMSYSKSGSGAVTSDVIDALKNRFGYASAIWGTESQVSNARACEKTVYASLDAGCPVIFSICFYDEKGVRSNGHAVVGDGYGYNTVEEVKTPYVHLNMGWNAQNDWWYNLPNIATGENPEQFEGFNTVEGVGYNIFPKTNGRIVSGRVLDIDGNPAAARVSLAGLSTETSETGVYAFIVPTDVPSGIYEVRAESEDGQYVGTTSAEVDVTGKNSWGNDMALARPAVRIGEQVFSTLDQAFDAVQDGDVVEILLPTVLRRSCAIGVSCTITSAVDQVTDAAVNFLKGVTLSVAAPARVLFQNVAFTNAAQNVVITVAKGGTAAVKGYVGVQEFDTADAVGFELAGRITTGFVLDCAGKTSATDVIGRVTASEDELEGCAANIRIRNEYDPNGELGGKVSGGDLIWGAVPVPDESAVVRLVFDDGTHTNFMTFVTLTKYMTPNVTAIEVCKDCEMTVPLTVTNNLTITSSNGLHTVTAANLNTKTYLPGFEITGGTLTVSNVVFSGYSGPGLMTVDGGKLVLGEGARLTGMEGSFSSDYPLSGAITVWSGSVTLLPGCEIDHCTAYYGGAVCLVDAWQDDPSENPACTLNLFGGDIHDCIARTYGGGIYVGDWAAVNVKGDVRVKNNVMQTDGGRSEWPDDNICFAYLDDRPLAVVGELTDASSIGLWDNWEETNNDVGARFAEVADGVDAASVASKFFCDILMENGNRLVGEVGEDGKTLVWKDGGKGDDPANAKVLVIYPSATTNYWQTVEDAFGSLLPEDEVIVELKEDMPFGADLEVNCTSVLLRSQTGSGTLTRSGDFSIVVVNGSALTITNLVLDGGGMERTKPLVQANGGSLVLEENAVVQNAIVKDSGAGIYADGGAFTMKDGASISNCWTTAEDGEGAGLWTSGTRVRLEGGSISGCSAALGGGVCCWKGELYVSGNAIIDDNSAEAGGTAPNLNVNGTSIIRLAGDFTGSIGVEVYDGYDKTDDVFGVVDADYLASADVQKLIGGAARFSYDGTNETVTGCVVTNGTRGLLVWPSALRTDPDTEKKYYEDDGGTRYGLVNGEEPPTPVIVDPDPIAFESITRISDTEWKLVVTNVVPYCNYRLLWTKDLTKGFTSTGDWAQAAADAPKAWTNDVVTEGGAWFWKAEGKEGQKQ